MGFRRVQIVIARINLTPVHLHTPQVRQTSKHTTRVHSLASSLSQSKKAAFIRGVGSDTAVWRVNKINNLETNTSLLKVLSHLLSVSFPVTHFQSDHFKNISYCNMPLFNPCKNRNCFKRGTVFFLKRIELQTRTMKRQSSVTRRLKISSGLQLDLLANVQVLQHSWAVNEVEHPTFDGLIMFTIEINSNEMARPNVLWVFSHLILLSRMPAPLGLPPSPQVVITTE